MSISSEESENNPRCGECGAVLEYYRDGHEDDGYRCHNCYWEEQNARARKEKDIVELEPEYRPSEWLKKNRPHIWKEMNKKGGKKKKKRRTRKKNKTQKRFPIKYLPNKLTKKDRKKQKKQLLKSQEDYKKGIYHTREKVKSYDVKPSKYVVQAKKMYDIDNVKPSKELAKKTGCSIKGLNEIVKKGQGAYYSSGSRPNQSGHSWGIARMASVITGNKAAAVDFHIVEKHCDKTKKGYKTALKGKKKHGRGTRKVRKVA